MAAAGPILIAGGGIGGLALALALAKAGRNAVVLEQHEQFATAGAGIQLGPNGVKVLERLGLAPALRPLVGEPEAIRVRDGRSGRLLTSLPLGPWIAARHGAPYWSAHRGDLHGALLAAASAEPRITLRTGFALATFAEEGDTVMATSTTGGTASAARSSAPMGSGRACAPASVQRRSLNSSAQPRPAPYSAPGTQDTWPSLRSASGSRRACTSCTIPCGAAARSPSS